MDVTLLDNFFPVHTNEDWPNMPPIRFKGKGSSQTTSRVIPGQTHNEAVLENGLMNYSNTGLNGANGFLNNAIGAANNTVNTDWNSVLGKYNSTMNGVNQGYQSLANGQLPQAYTDNIMSGLNNLVTSSMGNAVNNLAKRGVIGSSQGDTAFANIANSVASTAADKYMDATNLYSNVLGQQANNASNLMNNTAMAQQNSWYQPNQMFNFANNLSNSGQNMYNTMYGGRMGTGSTTTNTNDGGAGAMGALGTIGSALIMCFAAGTKIATPDGEKNIEDIELGDRVLSLDDNNNICTETVKFIMIPSERPVLEVVTDKGAIKCTKGQPFVTVNGPKNIEDVEEEILTIDGYAEILEINELPAEMVYDFTASGKDVFFANGFAVEGWD